MAAPDEKLPQHGRVRPIEVLRGGQQRQPPALVHTRQQILDRILAPFKFTPILLDERAALGDVVIVPLPQFI